MATLDILNLAGEQVDKIDLSDNVFNVPVKEHLLHEVVVAQLEAGRRGTACTKGRSEIRGSNKKLYRQKGTGRARHGSAKSPTYVGGGVVFGPKPRSYAKRITKKVRASALRSALSLKTGEQKLIVLEDFSVDEIKTKRIAQVMDRLGVKSGLIIDDKTNLVLIKSVKNLSSAKYLAPEGINVYDILRYDSLIVTAPVAKQIEERLLP